MLIFGVGDRIDRTRGRGGVCRGCSERKNDVGWDRLILNLTKQKP